MDEEKKPPTFYRRTISISADLHKRMEKVSGVNWSRVAARAFEAKLKLDEKAAMDRTTLYCPTCGSGTPIVRKIVRIPGSAAVEPCRNRWHLTTISGEARPIQFDNGAARTISGVSPEVVQCNVLAACPWCGSHYPDVRLVDVNNQPCGHRFHGSPITVIRPGHCPTCDSPNPTYHPAVQHEGEVVPCGDPFHTCPLCGDSNAHTPTDCINVAFHGPQMTPDKLTTLDVKVGGREFSFANWAKEIGRQLGRRVMQTDAKGTIEAVYDPAGDVVVPAEACDPEMLRKSQAAIDAGRTRTVDAIEAERASKRLLKAVDDLLIARSEWLNSNASTEDETAAAMDEAMRVLARAATSAREQPAMAPELDGKELVSPLNHDHDLARSVHRVIRAMHDGECPCCHTLHPSDAMIVWPTLDNKWPEGGNGKHRPNVKPLGHRCPTCNFTLTSSQAEAGLTLFAKFMEQNFLRFREWLATMPQEEVIHG